MSGHTAQRTLVKSPPELWAELSDAASLAKHLGEFGEIRITRLEPETVVAWEGDRANGTVSLEPAGWGTRVTLTAMAVEAERVVEIVAAAPAVEPEPEPLPEPEPEPAPEPEAELEPEIATPAPAPKLTVVGRIKRWLTRGNAAAMWQISDEVPITPPVVPEPDEAEPASEPPEPIPLEPPPAEPEPDPEPPAAAEAEPAALDETAIAGVLTDVLDTLGAAHHRPFSRG